MQHSFCWLNCTVMGTPAERFFEQTFARPTEPGFVICCSPLQYLELLDDMLKQKMRYFHGKVARSITRAS